MYRVCWTNSWYMELLNETLTYWPLGDQVVILKLKSPSTCYWLKFMRTCCEITIRWMLQSAIDIESVLVKGMSWCRQATSRDLSQSGPSMTSGVTKP